MSNPKLVLLHAPSNYDFRERSIVYGPISDVIPSSHDEEKELCLAATISKRELEWPARSFTRSMPRILWNLIRN